VAHRSSFQIRVVSVSSSQDHPPVSLASLLSDERGVQYSVPGGLDGWVVFPRTGVAAHDMHPANCALPLLDSKDVHTPGGRDLAFRRWVLLGTSPSSLLPGPFSFPLPW
jgi:hypothetical protein